RDGAPPFRRVPGRLESGLRRCRRLSAVVEPLAATLGRVLAEDVASDLDMPPFDKATMDGYAVRCAHVAGDAVVLPVQAEVTAGRDAPPLRAGHAIRIMTGAPVPAP